MSSLTRRRICCRVCRWLHVCSVVLVRTASGVSIYTMGAAFSFLRRTWGQSGSELFLFICLLAQIAIHLTLNVTSFSAWQTKTSTHLLLVVLAASENLDGFALDKQSSGRTSTIVVSHYSLTCTWPHVFVGDETWREQTSKMDTRQDGVDAAALRL